LNDIVIAGLIQSGGSNLQPIYVINLLPPYGGSKRMLLIRNWQMRCSPVTTQRVFRPPLIRVLAAEWVRNSSEGMCFVVWQ
jgi:hypothetical protein